MTLSPVIRYSLLSLAFTIPAAWAVTLAGCLLWPGAPVCGLPYLYPLVTLGVIVLTLAPLGLTYSERARRRASRGMWQKPRGIKLEWATSGLWGNAGETDHPALLTGPRRRRWGPITVKNGQRVYVDKNEFYFWLRDEVEPLAKKIKPGESAISGRYWKPRLGEGLYLAYVEILDAVGATRYVTDDPRSRQYVPSVGAVWGRIEAYEAIVRSEEY